MHFVRRTSKHFENHTMTLYLFTVGLTTPSKHVVKQARLSGLSWEDLETHIIDSVRRANAEATVSRVKEHTCMEQLAGELMLVGVTLVL